MEIQLINGRFSVEEAEQLLTDIVKVKIAFHEKKIITKDITEEDIEHSERRILHLERTLRNAIEKLKESNQKETNIQAHIEVNFPPYIGQ